jgi:hypothetical protein
MKVLKQAVIRIPLFKKTLALQFRAWYTPISIHYGITNSTFDGYYIPFWDFAEEFKFANILNAIRATQNQFDLSTVYVLQSTPTESYRAVCFDKMTWTRCVAVIGSTECLDHNYLRFSIIRGRFVLRVTEKEGRKEKMVKALLSVPFLPRSPDHAAFFHAKYPEIPGPQSLNPRVTLSKYESFR